MTPNDIKPPATETQRSELNADGQVEDSATQRPAAAPELLAEAEQLRMRWHAAKERVLEQGVAPSPAPSVVLSSEGEEMRARWSASKERVQQLAEQERQREAQRAEAARLRDQEEHRQIGEEETTALEAILERQRAAIETFVSLALRKLRAVDEYGDRDWKSVGPEFARFLGKVAERERLRPEPLVASVLGDDPSEIFDSSGQLRLRPRHARFVLRWFLLCSRVVGQLHEAVQSDTGAFALKDWERLSGVEFEGVLAQLLKKMGFEGVRGTAATGDQGGDLLFEKNGRKFVAQAKRYSAPVGNAAVQQVIGAMHVYRADEAWVITNSSFTPSARELAVAANVRLVDGEELRDLAARHSAAPSEHQ